MKNILDAINVILEWLYYHYISGGEFILFIAILLTVLIMLDYINKIYFRR